MPAPAVAPLDPLDLPDWLGEQQVTWVGDTSLDGRPLVHGCFRDGADRSLAADVLAGDLAYPVAVLGEGWRHDAHQAWALDQVFVVSYQERLALVVPGTTVTSEVLLEAVRRFSKAVGSRPDRFSVTVHL